MNELLAYLAVLLAAAIPWLEVLVVVPAGILAGLPPAPTALVGAIGNASTLIPLVLVGARARAAWRRRRSVDPVPDMAGFLPSGPMEEPDHSASGLESRRGGRARVAFDRFGLPGLAVLGPLLTGVHVAALVALAAGAPKRATILWLTAGITAWAALAAGATAAGLDTFGGLARLPSLFTGES